MFCFVGTIETIFLFFLSSLFFVEALAPPEHHTEPATPRVLHNYGTFTFPRVWDTPWALKFDAAKLLNQVVATAIPSSKLYGDSKLETLVPVRTLKLSNLGRGKHLDGYFSRLERRCCSYKYCKIPEAEKKGSPLYASGAKKRTLGLAAVRGNGFQIYISQQFCP